jgi:hypothetical protein
VLLCDLYFTNSTSTYLISKAGVATGTMYSYFKNKVELINELYISIKTENLAVSFQDLLKTSLSYESIKKFWMESVEWGVKLNLVILKKMQLN